MNEFRSFRGREVTESIPDGAADAASDPGPDGGVAGVPVEDAFSVALWVS